MSQKKIQNNTIQIIIVTTVISLAVGFFCGVGYSNYRSRIDKNVQEHSLHQENIQNETSDDQYEKQQSTLMKEVSQNPGNIDAWTQLGNLYFDHGEVIQAIAAYKKSLELDPNNANVWTDLGVMYRRNGEFHVATASFSRANEINPQHEVSLLNKGIVLFYDLKDTSGAVVVWEKLVALNENASTSGGQLIVDLIQSIKH